ncbi:MAG: STAS domain-containing protein [Pyrinomonadaceae bacterium]
MAFRIQTTVNKETVTFKVSGRLDVDGIAELKRMLEGYREEDRLVLDLEDLGLVDRFVIRSLTAFEVAGVRLVNCPPYVRDWILRDVGSA